MNAAGTCTQCKHPFDPHVLGSLGDPLEGGFVICPVRDCTCFSTYSAQGYPVPEVTEEMFAAAVELRRHMWEEH